MSTIAAGLTSTNALVSTGDTSGQLVFQTNGTTTAMTIDTSQNVGIGGGSSGARLQLNTTTSNSMRLYNTSGNGTVIDFVDQGWQSQFEGNAGSLIFRTGGTTERMRIDSSGNVGIGVTPTTWSQSKALQINSIGAIRVDTSTVGLNNNAYYNSGWKYLTTAAASTYEQYNGTHAWNIAPSGTAGNAISFTQAMTLDASGNLAVGGYAAGNTVKAQNNVGGYATLGITSSADSLGYLDATNLFLFRVNATERMRIDSFGNLLVGVSSIPPDASNANGKVFKPGEGACVLRSYANITGSVVHNYFFNPNGLVGGITTNASATTYSTSSDYRLKENIAPMQNALDTVSKLKPVTYTWKIDGSNGQGFIAHELQAIVPDCVTGEKDAVDEEGKPVYQGIDTSFLVATLTKAIQEQQAIINELKSRIETLENK